MSFRPLFRSCKRTIYMQKRTGLRKNAEEVLQTNSGHRYEHSDTNLQHVKSFLSTKYAIPDEMALQVLTHKSFANGIKPYNEKLSVMGSKLISLLLGKYLTASSVHDDMAVNGRNLDVFGTPMAREIGGRMALGVFAQKSNLNNVMFWKSYNHSLSFEASGELKVSAQMMYALIGAVAFVHGKKEAENFILEKLMGSGDSIESIAASYLEQA